MENFGERLRKLRGQHSQKGVAAELGIPQTTLSTLENQKSIPRGEVVQKFADYYKVTISYFYRSTSTPVKPSDAARAALYELRQPIKGKDTIATQANPSIDDALKERIAERIRKKYGRPSDDQ